MPAEPTRFDRQSTVIPTEELLATSAVVIGVGAIGRQVALQLSACGIGELHLVDFDTVDIVNVGPQGYKPADVGKPKCAALIADCIALNPDGVNVAHEMRFCDAIRGDVYFCCVDSIKTRGQIFDEVAKLPDTELFIDARMSAETIRVITEDNFVEPQYRGTIFEPAEAFQGACTAKSTIFTANIAAGLMVSQFSKYLRGMALEKDFNLNLLSLELFPTPKTMAAAAR